MNEKTKKLLKDMGLLIGVPTVIMTIISVVFAVRGYYPFGNGTIAWCDMTQQVIPMTADCADYETYRSGKYVPGLMGTLFSFIDKLVSSLAPFVASICLAAIGFKEVMPDVDTPYSPQLKAVGIFLMYGLVSIGLIFNVIAMKFYPLTAEKMAEVREKIAEIKEQNA